MSALMMLCLIFQSVPVCEDNGTTIRLGVSSTASFPSMEDEKEFADMMNAAGLSFELAGTAWGGTAEILGDLTSRFRLRGGISVSRLHGAYSKGYDPMTYIVLGILSLGMGFFIPQDENVIDLNDEAFSIETEMYYLFSRSRSVSFSVGAGPMFTFAGRRLDSPNTSTKGNGTGFGMMASLRLDQESRWKLGFIPLMFGLEAGYRMNAVEIDNNEAGDFQLDFSGLFLKVGSYIGL